MNYLITTNDFIARKYTIDSNICFKDVSFYLIFFFKLINLNKNKITEDGLNFIGSYESYFGIFNSYQEEILKCQKYLYFSFSLQQFLFYKVYTKNNYIVGKLFKNITIQKNKLVIEGIYFNLPKTFIKLHKNVFALKKQPLKIGIKNIGSISCIKHNKNFTLFCDNYRNENIYYLNIPHHLNKEILNKLYKYLVVRFPILENKSNNLFIDPINVTEYKSYFSMYIYSKKQQLLVLHFNQILFQYIDKIISGIETFFIKIKENHHIITEQYSLKYNKGDQFIHIVSEIYYLIVIILFKMPSILKNLNFIENRMKTIYK